MATVGLVSACCLALTAAPAYAGGDRWGGGHGGRGPITVVAKGLDGPFQLAEGYGNSIIVTQALKTVVTGTPSDEVTRIDLRTGRTNTVNTVPGASGASLINGRLAVITGGDGPVNPATLLVGRPGATLDAFADIMAFELAENPDGQLQFGPDGNPVDALSNPFAVIADPTSKGFALVTDGGGNSVLRVDRKGKVSSFFVPPVVTSGECAGRPNNDAEHAGCDPVPTGIATGPRGTVFVAGLSGEAPGEGRVYVLDAWSGALRRTLTGFDGPTGVAVDARGNLYVAELLHNAPTSDTPTADELKGTGRITRVARDGSCAHADVTMPNGLLISGGKLYASAWSVGPFFGQFGVGQVVRIDDSAFDPATDCPTMA